jgi:secreted trypsin-like serine protease
MKSDALSTEFIAGAPNNKESYPVGVWPWMASFGLYDENDDWVHLCGATLITDKHFLTAAHCVQQREDDSCSRQHRFD